MRPADTEAVMCFNPYQYDQMTRDAASRMQGVSLARPARAPRLAPIWARLKALWPAAPSRGPAKVEPAE